MNARIGSLGKKSEWGWSLGAAVTQGDHEAKFGLFTGPFFSIGRRLFVTAAYHLSEETRLAGGFNIGDEVPDDLQGDIPTSTKDTGALLITFTFAYQ